jgi:DMSO reductase anchor subunit
MHPAYSVIFFTVSSGLGFGVLMLLGFLALIGRLAPNPWLAGAVMIFALGTAAAGLMASALHLGHPERAWRAFSQWRTSWLSREGIAAIATFPPALLFALGWVVLGDIHFPFACAAGVAALLALATVSCTGMIYQSLTAIRAWATGLVTPGYVIMALAGAALWLAFAWRLAGNIDPMVTHLPLGAVLAAWALKAIYWRRLDAPSRSPTVQSATGLGGEGVPVRLLESPHTQENFVMREMGYRIARKHAVQLRRVAQGLAFVLPLVITQGVAQFPALDPRLATALVLTAAVSGTLGLCVERWLFFAEARHAVTLYYGAART